jgi:hypothetical protein
MRWFRAGPVGAALLGSFALAAAPALAQPLPPQMHTVAGGGSCTITTPSPNPPPITMTVPCGGVSATSVSIDQARSVAALPGGGFLYVNEGGGNLGDGVVQEVSQGTVTTVAGGGSSCAYSSTSNCDGMSATSVELDDPVSVAPLPGGGFLVTEYAGGRVLMVSPAGIITTVAGTASSPLTDPSDAEPTADGGVLIANSGCNDIRYVAPDGTISTVAGGGTCNDPTTSCAGLNQPVSVSPIQGGSGGYLIADYGADAIVVDSQISAAGTCTTVAGIPGQSGYGGDGGPATAAQLSDPRQVVSLAGGGFLIADTGNEVIRQVSPAGTITTIAGTPLVASVGGDGGAATSALLDDPAAVSQLPNGNTVIADEDNNLIREMTIPSVSTISLSPSSPNGTNGWYTSSITATVTATEGATINCILDPPEAPPAFAAFPPGCSFTSSGGTITGNGSHALYAASMNSFGDQENPVDAMVKIDTTPPTMSCNGTPSFKAESRNATVTATVSDPVSGPLSATVSAPANTSHVGKRQTTLVGSNKAGLTFHVACSYSVLPLTLEPTPTITARFSAARKSTTVRRLAVNHVPGAAVVNVTCEGKGCPFTRAFRVTGLECEGKPCQAKAGKRYKRPRSVNLTALFKGATLAVGDRLMVSVTETDTVGRAWGLTTRAGKTPSDKIECLAPGSSVPDRGCTAPRGR